MSVPTMTIALVREEDLPDLLPLMRAYCDFYDVAPTDEGLLGMAHALLADPLREGVQLIARDSETGAPLGFATIFWSWSTLNAARIATMNDLFVAPEARGTGLADALIGACRDHAREHGTVWLGWQTAKDNERAQKVYDRVGGERSEWIDYGLRP